MTDQKPVECWLTDMDGVLVHEEQALPGAADFIDALQRHGRRFLVLTNNSFFTARDLRARLLASGIDVPEACIWTSALATAQFLSDQIAGGSAYVIGEAGLTSALHNVDFVLTERNPDYVVLGETRTYSFEGITRAIRLIERGARFIATNPDPTGPSPEGSLPATGSVAALITQATGIRPVFCGQAEPADDALGAERDRCALREHGDGGRPDGHRHGRRHRGGVADHPGADRIDPRRPDRTLPVPADPGLRFDRRCRAAGGGAGADGRTYRMRRSTVLRSGPL